MQTFTVIYKTGGTLNSQWHRVLENYTSREAAQGKAAEVNRAGYETLIHDTARLEAVGLPE